MNNPSETVNSISNLGRYGLVGVMLFLITAVIIAFLCTYRLAVTQMSENNKIMTNLTVAVNDLITCQRFQKLSLNK